MNKTADILQTNNTPSDKTKVLSYGEIALEMFSNNKSGGIFSALNTSLSELVWIKGTYKSRYRAIQKPIFKKEQLDEISITSKLKNKSNEKLSVSSYDTTTDKTSPLLETTFDDYDYEYSEIEQLFQPQLKIEALFSGSTKQLLRRLAFYTGQKLSTLFRVLRNTRIHSFSIFFGLCCSSSSYIFEAITGTSSHPIPAKL